MELLRTLAALAEPPLPEHARLAALLGLEPPPDEASYNDLFLFQLFPFASVYLEASGMVGGEARDRIAGFLRALGVVPTAEPDHLAALLATYAHLGEREEEDGPPGRQGWRRARHAFLWEHLLAWLPPFLARVGELAPPSYRRWGAIVATSLAAEAATVGPPATLPLHLRRAPPPVPDPRQDGAEPFLAALLAPVRSGLVIARDDLRRAARELDLGSRPGERRWALAALLSQEPAATLRWLAEETARQQAAQQALPFTDRPIASFWSDRAAATAGLLRELASDALAP